METLQKMATALEIIDTAVKIGLGALISGIAAYWHSKMKYKADSAKEYEKRHRSLLEHVAEDIESFNHIYLKFGSYVLDWVRSNNQGQKWHPEKEKRYQETSDELFNAFKSLTSAESKLLLIGENDAYLKLRQLGDVIAEFRSEYNIGNKPNDEQEIINKKKEIKIIREELFNLLSNTYQTNFI